MITWLVYTLGPVVVLGFFVLGVLVGCIGSAYLRREELRTAQRGVDEARALLVSAGLWPPAPLGVEPVPAAPSSGSRGGNP